MEKLRIQKIVSSYGLASRRETEELIRDGLITINGRIAKLGDKANPEEDHIKVRGKLLPKTPKAKKVVVALFKPRGIPTLSSEERSKREPHALSLLKRVHEKVHPVGSLEPEVEGLLLFTNDGQLLERLNRSKYEVPQVFSVKIDGHLDDKKLKRLEMGLQVEDFKAKSLKLTRLKQNEGKEWLEIKLNSPRSRMVRKLLEAVGHPVDKIRRDSICNIDLAGLERGEYRYLDAHEVKDLRKWVGLGVS